VTNRRSDEEQVSAYERHVGRPPARLPEDHPDAWQWDYRGTPAERERLRGELGLVPDDEAPMLIEGQEEMF